MGSAYNFNYPQSSAFVWSDIASQPGTLIRCATLMGGEGFNSFFN